MGFVVMEAILNKGKLTRHTGDFSCGLGQGRAFYKKRIVLLVLREILGTHDELYKI